MINFSILLSLAYGILSGSAISSFIFSRSDELTPPQQQKRRPEVLDLKKMHIVMQRTIQTSGTSHHPQRGHVTPLHHSNIATPFDYVFLTAIAFSFRGKSPKGISRAEAEKRRSQKRDAQGNKDQTYHPFYDDHPQYYENYSHNQSDDAVSKANILAHFHTRYPPFYSI